MPPAPQLAGPTPDRRPPGSPGLESLLRAVASLLEQWRLVFGLPTALAVVMAVVSLILTPYYRARASFIVDSDQRSLAGAGSLAGLASEFGLSVGQTGSESPAFYADLARTDEVLLAVASARYAVPHQPDSTAPLWAIYRMKSPEAPRWREVLLKRMRADVKTDVGVTTGTVSVTVDATGQVLAASVADTLLAALNRFNLERRQLRSRETRRFLETRVAEARQQLRAAEDTLRTFRDRNRLYQQSEDLRLQDQRLQREVNLQQQLYTTLATSYEQARIEEVRDTPTLTVVDAPEVPYDKVWPRRRVLVLGAFTIGLVLSVGIGLLRGSVRSLTSEERREWEMARAAAGRVPLLRALVKPGR